MNIAISERNKQKTTNKKKKQQQQNTVASILHNADKDESGTDSEEEDQTSELNSLLTFAKGKVAEEKRKEALEVGVFVAANKEEEQTISATQQLKIDARLKKKEDAILKERSRKKAFVTQGIAAIVSTEDLLKDEFDNATNNSSNAKVIDDFFFSINSNNNNNNYSANLKHAREQISKLKDDERVAKFKEHFEKGQSYAQKKIFQSSLMHLKIAFQYLVNTTTSKYAAMCIGTAASVEFALGELRNAKNHSKQALTILKHLNVRDQKLEQIFTRTLNKTLDDLGESATNSSFIVVENNSNKNNKNKQKNGGKRKNNSTASQSKQQQPQSTSDLLKSLGL
jgi:hypothetical protein